MHFFLGALRVNIGTTAIKEKAYFTLVRPLVGHASTVWDPIYPVKHQRTGNGTTTGRKICDRNLSSVSDMLATLNWRSLLDRRKDARLCMMFKIEPNLVAIRKENDMGISIRESSPQFEKDTKEKDLASS